MKKNNLLNVVVFSLGVNIFPDLQTETTKAKLVALPLDDKIQIPSKQSIVFGPNDYIDSCHAC